MNYDSNKPYCGFDNINDLRSDLVEAFQESFKYDEDEARLNRNMVAFCSAAQLIDQDDIDEQNFFGGE